MPDEKIIYRENESFITSSSSGYRVYIPDTNNDKSFRIYLFDNMNDAIVFLDEY